MSRSSKLRRAAAAASTLALAATLGTVPASAVHEPPPGFVYVQTNDRTGNEVVVYRRAANGSLTQVREFSTGGIGFGQPGELELGPDDTDSPVIISPNRRWLLAVNAGSDTIAVFRIQPDGLLRPAEGSPFPSGGVMPASLAMQGNLLYVANKDNDPARPETPQTPNYTAFRLDRFGALTPVPGSTLAMPEGSSPSQIYRAENRLFFSAEFFGGTLRSYHRQTSGRLVQTDLTPVTPASTQEAPNFPIGMDQHPEERILYVGQPTVGVDLTDLSKRFGEVGVYRYDEAGDLTYVRSVQSSGSAVCWLVVSHDGQRLYTSNTLSNSIDTFDVSDPLHPRLIDTDSVAEDGAPRELALDASGRFLHVVSHGGLSGDPTDNQLSVFRIGTDGEPTFVDAERVGGPAGRAAGLATTG